jgi:hypothetical protein
VTDAAFRGCTGSLYILAPGVTLTLINVEVSECRAPGQALIQATGGPTGGASISIQGSDFVNNTAGWLLDLRLSAGQVVEVRGDSGLV